MARATPSRRTMPAISSNHERRITSLEAKVPRPEAVRSTYDALGKGIARLADGSPAYQRLTASSAAYGDAAVTDFALTDVVADDTRLYTVTLHSQFSQNTTDNWLHNFRDDGTVAGRFHVYNTAANAPGQISGAVLWLPTTGEHDLSVQVEQITAIVFGDAITYEADATAPRFFWVEDIGPR